MFPPITHKDTRHKALKQVVRLVSVWLSRRVSKINLAQCFCSRLRFYNLFYCQIDLNKDLSQPFNCSMLYLARISISVWYSKLPCVQIALPFMSVSCQNNVLSVLMGHYYVSLLRLRQCEQHCVCALRFRKWEFMMVIDHRLFDDEGIETVHNHIKLAIFKWPHEKNTASSQCHSRDLFSSDVTHRWWVLSCSR